MTVKFLFSLSIEIIFISRNNTSQKFEIMGDLNKQYRRFNTVGTQISVRLNPPSETDADPLSHFLASGNDLFEHAVQSGGDSYMAGLAIDNEVNQNVKPIGSRFGRKDQIAGDVIWKVFEKIPQSNSQFNV